MLISGQIPQVTAPFQRVSERTALKDKEDVIEQTVAGSLLSLNQTFFRGSFPPMVHVLCGTLLPFCAAVAAQKAVHKAQERHDDWHMAENLLPEFEARREVVVLDLAPR